MRSMLLAVAVLLFAPKAHALTGSAGGLLAYPELFGVYGSIFVAPQASVDARLTLATVDVGLTLRTGVQRGGGHLLFSILGGYTHAAVHSVDAVRYHSPHLGALAGVGWLGSTDLRIMLGAHAAKTSADSWSVGPTFVAQWGVCF